ncbi:MAG TPA: hypothetical protein VJH92_01295 [Candidatus Nanoarchaeia archaeon]|nr:hypothetical protein [Candidatus Nanoarchaeia archaeon]
MDKIAVGLVLIPPENILDLCIKINERAFESGRGRFRLARDDYIPHITLAMDCISRGHFDEVVSDMSQTIKFQRAVYLEAREIELYTRGDGNRSFLKLNIPDDLRALHEKSLEILVPYSVNCDSADCLLEGDKTGMTDFTRKTINGFPTLYARERYNPHITLGCYDADQFSQDIQFPIPFEANRLVLAHLGNNCTVRKVLFETKLN